MKKIKFKTKLYNIGNDTVLRLPVTASSKLSSRGLVMVEGKINRFNFRTALEPDGAGSHWFQLDSEMLKGIGVKSGDVVNLEIWQIEKWLEPKVPLDLNSLLKKNRYALTIWNDITPLARWEWIRWINATKILKQEKKELELQSLN